MDPDDVDELETEERDFLPAFYEGALAVRELDDQALFAALDAEAVADIRSGAQRMAPLALRKLLEIALWGKDSTARQAANDILAQAQGTPEKRPEQVRGGGFQVVINKITQGSPHHTVTLDADDVRDVEDAITLMDRLLAAGADLESE